MRTWSAGSRRTALVAIAAAGLALLAACGGKKAPVASALPSQTPSPTATVKPWLNPLTGLPGGKGHKLIVVKIDNTHAAHPQVGLNLADVGYIEEVEGGLTRIAAVFSDKYPSTVGPVRSARETDIELFKQYGQVAFVYSGAQPAVNRELDASNLHLMVDGFAGAWFRSSSRPAPYNLFAQPKGLLADGQGVRKIHDVGFRFGKAPTWMKPGHGFSVSFPEARITWQWDAHSHRYVLSMDGSPSEIEGHGQLGADNVIVQYVDVHKSNLHDVNGNFTPFTSTVGKGTALFFRDGKVVTGRWSRPSGQGGTVWTVGKHSVRYHMRPGHTWIVLVPSWMHIQPTR